MAFWAGAGAGAGAVARPALWGACSAGPGPLACCHGILHHEKWNVAPARFTDRAGRLLPEHGVQPRSLRWLDAAR